LYSDVVIILCNSSFIPVLYGLVPLETGIARDSLFLGLSQRCRESGFHSRKFGSFHVKDGDGECSLWAPKGPIVRLTMLLWTLTIQTARLVMVGVRGETRSG
jgi:hypothetical protein